MGQEKNNYQQDFKILPKFVQRKIKNISKNFEEIVIYTKYALELLKYCDVWPESWRTDV
jgi:hypothetical protein